MAQATHSNTSFSATDFLSLIARPFRATWEFLIKVAENSHQMEEIRKLNAITDEELARKGLTRMGEINRIFGGRIYL